MNNILGLNRSVCPGHRTQSLSTKRQKDWKERLKDWRRLKKELNC